MGIFVIGFVVLYQFFPQQKRNTYIFITTISFVRYNNILLLGYIHRYIDIKNIIPISH